MFAQQEEGSVALDFQLESSLSQSDGWSTPQQLYCMHDKGQVKVSLL